MRERTPLYFGPAEASLFGWYHAPAGERRDLAVVICPPLGNEYISAHRTVRHLADRLAEAGVPALRFDYDGTGDSAGDDEQPGRVAAWRTSIRAAMDTLRELSGCARVGLVGIRLGGTLAASVAAETDVASLALLWPAMRGRAYVREMKALHMTGGHGGSETDFIEPGGFVMTAETQKDVSALVIENLPAKSLLIERDDLGAGDGVRMPGYVDTFTVPHNTKVPHEAINKIVEWFERCGSEPSARSSPGVAGRGPAATQNQELGPIRESILQFDNIFGIVSEPVAAVSGAPTILLPNAGATHHVGPNRLYVVIARQLARAGFRVLRFDLPGLGDSFIDDPEKENDSYYPEASMIIERAMAAMSGQSFVVTGLCSGAHASFHAAMDLERAPIAETILINPLTFYYHAGMSLDQPSTAHYAEWQWYMQSMRSMERWRKLLRGEARIGSILRTAAKRFQDIAGRKFRRTKAVNDLAADLRRITEAGRRLTFVFSRFDPGYDLLTINAGSALKRLQKRGLVKLWRIDNATHTFEAKHSRDQMIESLKTHLTDRYVSGVRRP